MSDTSRPSSLRSGISRRQMIVGGIAGGLTMGAGLKGLASPSGELAPLPSRETLRSINPAIYPSLSRTQLGMLDYQYRKATAKKGDWSLWEPSVVFGEGPGMAGTESEGTQYDLFGSACAVAHAANKTPAYREFAETVLGGIAEKGFEDRCWRYWTEAKGATRNNGLLKPYSPSPVARSGLNAMYLGNFVGALGYYALMTDNHRFAQPQKFVYEGKGVEFAGQKVAPGTIWHASWTDLVEALSDEIMVQDNRLVMCQINTIYFMCNLSIAQGLLAHDKVLGTSHSDILYRKGGFFEKNGEDMFVPPRSSGLPIDWVEFGQRKLGGRWTNIGQAFAGGDLYLPFGMYPTKSDWALDAYDMVRRRWLFDEPGGLASWGVPPEEAGRISPEKKAAHTVMGAVGAAFARDSDTHRRTMDFIKQAYEPVWDGDTMVYKLTYEKPEDYLRAGRMQAIALLAHLAKEGSPMAGFDIDRRRFLEPTLCEAPYPDVKVKRATFDRDVSALVLSLNMARPGSFRVSNLRPGSDVIVLMDDAEPEWMSVPNGPEGLRIPAPAGDHDFVIGVQV